jgi:hypothetical protein
MEEFTARVERSHLSTRRLYSCGIVFAYPTPTSYKSLSLNFLLFHGTLAFEDDPWAQWPLSYFYPLL